MLYMSLNKKANRLLGWDKLEHFWIKHPQSKEPLKSWVDETNRSLWSKFIELKNRYPKVRSLKKDLLLFNIGGNDFRLIVKVDWNLHTVSIRWIGTHAEYDKIKDPTKI